MTSFFLDLWQDLREKRLWPVAVGLLAAAIAIPLVMLKPASDGATTAVVTPPAPKADPLPAVEVDSGPTHGSKLATFSQRDPFKPMSDLKTADASSSTSSPSSTSTSTSSSKSSTASSASATPAPVTSTKPSISSSPSSSSTPSTPSTPSNSTPTTTTPVKWFRYTADISFGEAGKEKTLKGVKDFTLLPDDKTAAIVFMGVSNDAKSALFFIADPAFTASGEGTCNDKQDCRFVKLALDDKKNEETFTSLDGSVVYKLTLLKLNREFISPNQAQGDTTSSKVSPKHGKDAGSTIADANQSVLPRLLDLGGVASK